MGELFEKHPEVLKVFLDRGMLCFGCPAEYYHTLEDASAFYGYNAEEIENEVKQAIIQADREERAGVADAGQTDMKHPDQKEVVMFCFQCQETAKNKGCTVRGVCGKDERIANLQDMLIFVIRGISVYYKLLKSRGIENRDNDDFIKKCLFATITNANWSDDWLIERIREGLQRRNDLKALLDETLQKQNEGKPESLPEEAIWSSDDEGEIVEKAKSVGVLSMPDEDVRSLRYLLLLGIKGICAYAEHASILGFHRDEIDDFVMEGLFSMTESLSLEDMTSFVMRAGEIAVSTMALLDEANTTVYGNPEATEVGTGVREKPGILISGHDLKDIEELLEQTRGKGIDIYTHGEMLPAHYYPAFKKYDHLAGNYGSSWWHQNDEFEKFNGPVLLTTNCLVPLKKSNTYLERLFTTGIVEYPGAVHIEDREEGKSKDFTPVIEKAKSCKPPDQIEEGKIVGGFGHNQVLAIADKIIDAVKTGLIRRFIVMAGCDGRHKDRDYFTEVANTLPDDTIILTAGCAKYRYNKLSLGYIGDIPRVLDAGQCNDSYSLAVIALKLKEAFGVSHINDLPISFDIAWYEQKAVAVLLALLSLGVKKIRLGPTLPAFLSPNVLKVLVSNFDIKPTGGAKEDIDLMMKGE